MFSALDEFKLTTNWKQKSEGISTIVGTLSTEKIGRGYASQSLFQIYNEVWLRQWNYN